MTLELIQKVILMLLRADTDFFFEYPGEVRRILETKQLARFDLFEADDIEVAGELQVPS